MVPLGLRILLTRSQIVWQCDRLATTSLRRVNKIASVPPYLLRSAFGHDGLWVFANRIFANWGTGLATLLARAQPGTTQPELRPDRHRHQGPRGARARKSAA